jgi:hypothetical protein
MLKNKRPRDKGWFEVCLLPANCFIMLGKCFLNHNQARLSAVRFFAGGVLSDINLVYTKIARPLFYPNT